MSAFIVSEECMHKAVTAICARSQYGQIIPRFAGIDTCEPTAATEIGRRLFTLNIEAIQQRYPDTLDNPDNMPGPCDDNGKSTALADAATYVFKGKKAYLDLVPGVKSLKCLAYQCAEGDVTETELFKELDAAAGEVALEIVRRMPAYDSAEWDA